MNHSSKYLAIYLVIVHIFLNQYPKYRHLGSITHYMLSFVLVCDAVTPLSLLKYPCSLTWLEKKPQCFLLTLNDYKLGCYATWTLPPDIINRQGS